MGLSEALSVRMGIDLFAGLGPAQRAQNGKGLRGHLGTGEKPVSLGSLVLCVCYLQRLERNTKHTK